MHAAKETDIPVSIQQHDARVQTTFIGTVPSCKLCCGLYLRCPSSKNYRLESGRIKSTCPVNLC